MSPSSRDNSTRFATDKYLFFSNSDSRVFSCVAVNAVRGRLRRSSRVRWRPEAEEVEGASNWLIDSGDSN